MKVHAIIHGGSDFTNHCHDLLIHTDKLIPETLFPKIKEIIEHPVPTGERMFTLEDISKAWDACKDSMMGDCRPTKAEYLKSISVNNKQP